MMTNKQKNNNVILLGGAAVTAVVVLATYLLFSGKAEPEDRKTDNTKDEKTPKAAAVNCSEKEAVVVSDVEHHPVEEKKAEETAIPLEEDQTPVSEEETLSSEEQLVIDAGESVPKVDIIEEERVTTKVVQETEIEVRNEEAPPVVESEAAPEESAPKAVVIEEERVAKEIDATNEDTVVACEPTSVEQVGHDKTTEPVPNEEAKTDIEASPTDETTGSDTVSEEKPENQVIFPAPNDEVEDDSIALASTVTTRNKNKRKKKKKKTQPTEVQEPETPALGSEPLKEESASTGADENDKNTTNSTTAEAVDATTMAAAAIAARKAKNKKRRNRKKGTAQSAAAKEIQDYQKTQNGKK